LFRKPEGKDHLEDSGTQVWITLKLILKKNRMADIDWTDLVQTQGHVAALANMVKLWV